MADSYYNILCIDGGGIRGIIPAIFLQRIEAILKTQGKTLQQHFDLIAGTSTGAILAAAIANGIPLTTIQKLYIEKGRKIFPYQSRWSLKRAGLLFSFGLSAPKYSDEVLCALLKEELGETLIKDLKDVKLIIPFYDTISRTTQFFKNTNEFASVPLWEAAVCSSSAPTFFPAHELQVDGTTYAAIDGGVAANNPVTCAIAEALKEVQDSSRIRVISLGTGESTRKIELEKAREWGAVEWALPIIDVLMDASLDVHIYVAKKIIGEENLLRLQFDLTGKKWGVEKLNDDLDDASRDNVYNLKSAAETYLNNLEKDHTLEDFVLKSLQPASRKAQSRSQKKH